MPIRINRVMWMRQVRPGAFVDRLQRNLRRLPSNPVTPRDDTIPAQNCRDLA